MEAECNVVCNNFERRGCLGIISRDEFNKGYLRCTKCREDGNRRDRNVMKKISEHNNEIKNGVTTGKRLCNVCHKEILDDCIDSKGNVSKKCKQCFENQKAINSKRGKHIRDYAAEYRNNPEWKKNLLDIIISTNNI